MELEIDFRPINAEATYAVRHPILRAQRPLSSCAFEGDHEASTLHFGAFHNKGLIGVLSAYKRPHKILSANLSYQVRGVAVLEHYQKMGVGKGLMLHLTQRLNSTGQVLIWLNARQKALPFYESLGYQTHGQPFSVPLIGLHYCCYSYV